MTRRTLMQALLVAGALFLVACGSIFDPFHRDRDQFNEARRRWLRAGVTDYEIVVHNECFCGYAGLAVRIVVQHGTVVSRTFVATGQAVPAEAASSFRDVEAMFGVVQDALERKPARLDAAYDAQYGYPRDVFIDYAKDAADEELGFVVESFTKH